MAGADKGPIVRIGDFFFKWRNYAFPVILLALFVGFRPAHTLFGSVAADRVRDWVAIGVVLAGLAVRFMTIGWAYIKRGGKQKKVYADTLVTSGYFGLCRNPLYVGNLMIYAGTFLLHGHPVVMVAGTALFLFIYICIVAAEEHFLRAKFGPEYDAYCARVARWVPDLSRLSRVTEGMSFSLNRAIVKDYTTIVNTVLSVIVVMLLERYWWADHATFVQALKVAGVILVAMAAFGLGTKLYKLRQPRAA